MALTDIPLSDGSQLVKGKKVAAFTNEEEAAVGLTDTVPFLLHDKLSEQGATMEKAADWTSKVVVDGKLVTGQNPQSSGDLGEAVAKLVNGA
jgi:putative intracellular protease/amidase